MPDEPDYIIDPMTLEDIEAVAAIEQASFRDPWPARYFFTELSSNKLARYLVVRHNNRVVAYIGSWHIFEEVHITTLAVEQGYRRQGLATLLIASLIDKTEALGAEIITLEVRPSNLEARAFYETLGFVTVGLRKRYYQDEDALIMTRVLCTK